MLAGIGRVPALSSTLVFKGGTALKKCYFGEYRFSEDLDFSSIGALPAGEEMEHAEQLKTRGWSRSRARDYYDLWRVLGEYASELELADFPDLVQKKCDVRSVHFDSPDIFFQKTMIEYVKKTWEEWLRPLVPDLPSFATVIDALRPRVSEILSNP